MSYAACICDFVLFALCVLEQIGTIVSASFLLLLGFINAIILFGIGRTWMRVLRTQRRIVQLKRTQRPAPMVSVSPRDALDPLPSPTTPALAASAAAAPSPASPSPASPSPASCSSVVVSDPGEANTAELMNAQDAYAVLVKDAAFGGLFARCCPVVLPMVDQPWKLYFVGVLFGLGFDTATEVALLAISATSSLSMPVSNVLVLPALFTAGMCLIGLSVYER